MTENTAVSHMCVFGERKIGAVGKPTIPGSTMLDPESKEICVRHRGLMMGYMYNIEKTRDTFTADGWLKTGDIGATDDGTDEGFYRIVGRIKELIITAGGENIPPVLIENAIKDRLPAVSNFVVIGDRQKMLVALITLKLKPDGSGGFTDELDLESLTVDPACETLQQAKNSKIWRQHINAAIEAYNEKDSVSRAQNIRRWHILDSDFTSLSDGGELTPTLKLKRNVVHSKFGSVIRSMYGKDFVAVPWAPTSTL